MNDYLDRQSKMNPSKLPLTQMNIFMSGGCSLTCPYCGTPSNGNGATGKSLPVEKIVQAIQEALPLGLRKVRLCGGEPLLHPGFDDLLDHLESLELIVQVETTGLGMSAERAARLASLPQCSVDVGLDGADAATHDLLHQPGSFDTAVKAARTLAAAGRYPQIISAVLRNNAHQIPAMIRLAETLGANAMRFILPVNGIPARVKSNGNGHHPGVANALTVQELIALGRRVERDFAYKTRLHLLYEQPPAFRGLHPNARIEGQGRCGILNSLGVLPSGDYALCGTAEAIPDLVFGQVGVQPLEQIWKGNRTLLTLRSGLPDRLEGVCERCIMKTSCLGSCAVENYLHTGSFFGPYWFCENADRVGLFPAGRLIENLI